MAALKRLWRAASPYVYLAGTALLLALLLGWATLVLAELPS